MGEKIFLDGSKILFHQDRIKDWMEGKKIAPVTIGCSITNCCNYNCVFCAAKYISSFQKDMLDKDVLFDFFDDAAAIGIKAVNLIGDGENTMHPYFSDIVVHAKQKGLDIGMATNGYLLRDAVLRDVLPCLSYIRFSICAADPVRYSEIHGAPMDAFYHVREIIQRALEIRKKNSLDVTIGIQMVLMPEFGDQILPLAQMGKELGVDYLQIKHCSDTMDGALHVQYEKYENLYGLLKQAEGYSSASYQVLVNWSKIRDGNQRRYTRCYGAPFFLQMAGDGTLAPCAWLTDSQYSRYHFGNIKKKRFKDIWGSERYWGIIKELMVGNDLNPQTDCCYLCWPHKTNDILWNIKENKMEIPEPVDREIKHQNFI